MSVDIVVYGATGYTGRLVTKYLAGVTSRPAVLGRPSFSWAVAGRSKDKLQRILSETKAPSSTKVIIADASDPKSIDAMVSGATVVIACVGPFSLYGEPVVEACIRHQKHYVDITGEFTYVHHLLQKFHDSAVNSRSCIVPCCGFDSVPSDLSNWLVNDFAAREVRSRVRSVNAYFKVKGGASRGTLDSMLLIMETVKPEMMKRTLLIPKDAPKPPRVSAWKQYGLTYDSDISSFTAPFIMAGINEKVVLRSNALSGITASYQEVFVGSFLSCFFMTAMLWTTTIVLSIALKIRGAKAWIEKLFPAPGQGTADEALAKNSFKTRAVGHCENGTVVEAVVQARNDAYVATAWFVAEIAIAVVERHRGNTIKGGILTPVTAVDPKVLISRFAEAGVQCSVSRR